MNSNTIITLTEILPIVRQLQTLDKLRLIRILAEQLDTGENIFPFEADKTYISGMISGFLKKADY